MVWMTNVSFSIYYKEIKMKQKRLQRTMIGGLFWLSIGLIPCFGQGNSQDSERDNAQWVNPFIGTALSDVPTLWGDYGGTYPEWWHHGDLYNYRRRQVPALLNWATIITTRRFYGSLVWTIIVVIQMVQPVD